jgi:hypothetical protein
VKKYIAAAASLQIPAIPRLASCYPCYMAQAPLKSSPCISKPALFVFRNQPAHYAPKTMPRPFPFPLNIGTDICSIPRILKILQGVNGRKFIKRVLSEREREEGIERLDGPIERWRAAGKTKSVLEWKRKELGLGIKELTRRRASAKGGVWSGKGSVNEREELRRELEREIRAEENVTRMKERWMESEKVGVSVVDEDSALISDGKLAHMGLNGPLEEGLDSKAVAKPTETDLHEKVDEVVGVEDEVEASGNEGPASLKQKRLDDADIMIRLMEENEKEFQIAEEALKKAAEFMAGRYVQFTSHLLPNLYGLD